jgi:hypothetical protein
MKIITPQECLKAYHDEQKRKQEEWDDTLPTRVNDVLEQLISYGGVFTSDHKVIEVFRKHGYRIIPSSSSLNSHITLGDI